MSISRVSKDQKAFWTVARARSRNSVVFPHAVIIRDSDQSNRMMDEYMSGDALPRTGNRVFAELQVDSGASSALLLFNRDPFVTQIVRN